MLHRHLLQLVSLCNASAMATLLQTAKLLPTERMEMRRPTVAMQALAFLVLCLLTQHTGQAEDRPDVAATWRYVASAEGDALPPLVTLPLALAKPEILRTEPVYRGHKQLYALLRYGSPNSSPVTLVVDERDGGEFDLYVDVHRYGELTAKELLVGKGRSRQSPLTSEITYLDRVPEEFGRQLLIRRGASGKSLQVGTLGHLQGNVALGGKSIAARRVDGDANGLFADPRDRLLLDLNGDGKFDPFEEQFPFQPVLPLGEKRYAVRSDAGGTRLALEEINGVGTIRITLAALRPGFEVREFELALMGSDGSAYSANSQSEVIAVPPGEYTTRSLRVLVENPQNKERWNYVFSRFDDPKPESWRRVAAGEELALDAVGKLHMAVEGASLARPIPAGRDITVLPRLYTQDGLLINSCDGGAASSRDQYGQGRTATVELSGTDGEIMSTYKSGFACGTFCGASLRVPKSEAAGQKLIRIRFDAGPLAGVLEAERAVEIVLPK
jgi:hypothetical protein